MNLLRGLFARRDGVCFPLRRCYGALYWYDFLATLRWLSRLSRTSAPMNVLTWENFNCESRGHFARCGGLCRLCEDGCDANYWVCRSYTLKAFQVVPKPTDPSSYLVAMILTWCESSSRASLCAFFLQWTLSLLFFASWLSVSVVVATSSLLCDFSYVHVSSIRLHECY